MITRIPILLALPAPRSFTTEDVLELHVHSGRAVISSILTSLSRFSFCRPAEPGEFTRRAFQGGRLDLTQVEGLKDLIDAETEGQRRIALRVAGVGESAPIGMFEIVGLRLTQGATRNRFQELRSEIIHCLAMIEALIDFGEGEDIEDGVYEQGWFSPSLSIQASYPSINIYFYGVQHENALSSSNVQSKPTSRTIAGARSFAQAFALPSSALQTRARAVS